MRTSNEFADRQSARTEKETRLEESSIFAPRPRLAAEKETVNHPAWRKWILFGALAIAMGVVLVIGAGSFGMGTQDTDQLAGFAGGGDTDTPTA
ncbi:MAG: hypothetical protein AB1750_19885, partial [Chloroflexota bacterium]